MCGGRAPVLSFAAASRIGLELAAKAPEAVTALHVAGVCVRKGRPEIGARRLARGVLALAARNPGLLDPILAQIEMRLRRPGVFEEFLRRQFADSPPDLAVIEADLSGPRGPERFRTALLDSAASARHDFLFQTDLGWDRVPPDLPLYLHHGAQDRIHPLPLIEELAASLSSARLHVHPDTGQLFHHDHLVRLLELVAAGMETG
jgi:pimeloyl-ACP methyl ester carboxylesterase